MPNSNPEQLCLDGRTMYTGTEQNDRIFKAQYGSDGATDPRYLIFGLAGDDTIAGANNNDELVGGLGEDRISGSGGHDAAWGHEDKDNFSMGSGDDYADGGSGNDWIRGNEGNDTLIGGLGENAIFGDSGLDLFVIQYARGSGDEDRVHGMEAGEKLIVEGIDSLNYETDSFGNLTLQDDFGQDIVNIRNLAKCCVSAGCSVVNEV